MLDNLQGVPSQGMPTVSDYGIGSRERDRAISKPFSQPIPLTSGIFAPKNDTAGPNKISLANSGAEQGKTVDFKKIADKLHSMLGEEEMSIEFSLDRETKRMILKVLDTKTKEIVQQFPPEITLKIARIVANALGNGNSGQVTNATA